MIHVRAPLPGDIETIGQDAAEDWVRDQFKRGTDFSELISKPFTHVATIDGRPIAGGGFFDRGDMAIAWSVVGVVPPNMFVTLCRAFRQLIEATPFKVVEAHCIATFHQSHRWVMCLGFEPVNGERCFMPDGREFRRFIFRNAPYGT